MGPATSRRRTLTGCATRHGTPYPYPATITSLVDFRPQSPTTTAEGRLSLSFVEVPSRLQYTSRDTYLCKCVWRERVVSLWGPSMACR